MKEYYIFTRLFILLVFNFSLIACNGEEDTVGVKDKAAAINWPCLNPPKVEFNIPHDTVLSDQVSFNCFAWQEFISLNWPSDINQPASKFGEPNDYSPVVFETYKNVHDFLNSNGTKPADWNEKVKSYGHLISKNPHIRVMNRTSKFNAHFVPSDIAEAFPSPDKAWLADKNGNLVWYEVLVNKDEFDYFYKNEFYNSKKQYEAAKKGQHIDLPKGDLSGVVGATEMKAAWLTVTNPKDKKWLRYKMAKAIFCSADKVCTESAIALVGLHIIHKTVSQPSWIWATFEHVDNAPDITEVKEGVVSNSFNFYNSSCKEKNIPAQCVGGKLNQKTSCVPNTSPAYALKLKGGKADDVCKAYPIQVVREYPLLNTNENPIRAINKAAQLSIMQANFDSVYQHYQLINVMWNDSTVDENKGKILPIKSLSETGFRPTPNEFPVSNTVLETYIQGTACIECHSNAKIASSPLNKNPIYASDYSFLFGKAGPKDK